MVAPNLVRVGCPLCGSSASNYERTVRGFTLERCHRCRFVFMNPQYGPEDLAKVYTDRDPERLIALYSRLQTPYIMSDYHRILGELESLSNGPKRLLDFGCGPGYFFECAGRRGWDAHGIEMGEWARKAAELRGLGTMHIGCLNDDFFTDGSFDVVTANQVVEHLPNPQTELRQIHRVLRPGGLFYLNVPNYRCLSIVLGRDDFELNTPPQHVNYFTPKTMRQLLETQGFEILRMSTYGGLKWENLFGRRTASEVSDVYREQARCDSTATANSNGKVARPRWLKRLVMPVVNSCCYRTAKVGLILQVLTRKR